MPKDWKVTKRKFKELKRQLLFNRGIQTKEETKKFFNPKISDYQVLLDIPGIQEAKKRIEKAIKANETIFVYGDYDVDGVSASAIVYHGLKSLGAKILPHIPHREKEGYGMSKFGLDEIKRQGGSLVITVDHGIGAVEKCEYAKEIGLDVIITDHHTKGSSIPKCVSLIHSTKMCGAAVAWCLMRKLISKELSQELLQFVCLGTVADLIPLTGLGRAFVAEGLEEINRTKNTGLKALILETGLIKGQIGSFEIGFILAPRLNAIGRLEHAIDALRLLCTKDILKATQLARLLCDTNVRRQKLTEVAYEQARISIGRLDKKIHVVDSSEWVPGIIGLIAARIVEQFSRPAIAISKGQDLSKGSARSVTGLNITEVIRTCSDILVDVGGHAGAAGFTIQTEKISIFKQRLDDYFQNSDFIFEESFLNIEVQVEKQELTFALARELEKFEPFGMGNSRPLFCAKNLKISDIKTVGVGKHLKFKAEEIDCIGFGMGELEQSLKSGQLIDLAFYLEINKFNGRELLQLKVKDLKPV